jgi:hypothetical protein
MDNLENTDLITTAVAVVGGGENCDNISVVGPVVALHHQLMGPTRNLLYINKRDSREKRLAN